MDAFIVWPFSLTKSELVASNDIFTSDSIYEIVISYGSIVNGTCFSASISSLSRAMNTPVTAVKDRLDLV